MFVSKSWLSGDVAAGLILIIAAGAAMFCANFSASANLYFTLLNQTFPLSGITDTALPSLSFWINDGLMTLFFFYIGLEVKQEFVKGALATRQAASLPMLAALGGMIAPAIIYLLCQNSQSETLSGWAIPTATDIAFALGILALLGTRVPKSLKIFLMTLAVIDDLGAIVIIALFYSHQLLWWGILCSVLITAGLYALNRRAITYLWPYLLLGLALWTSLLISGVHVTIAGVVVGMMLPVAGDKKAIAQQVAHRLEPWVRWGILPLFAFANAGISLVDIRLADLLNPLPLGIILGLVIGKPVGISLICAIGVKLGWVTLPAKSSLKDIAAIGLLCGIGFTMSVFITGLAFTEQQAWLADQAKLSILLGSLVAAVLGYFVLARRFSYYPN